MCDDATDRVLDEFLKTGRVPTYPPLPQRAAANRARIYDAIKEGYIFLLGGRDGEWYFCDTEKPFMQEANFKFVTCSDERDAAVVLDLRKRECHYFAPHLPEDYVVWVGHIESLEEHKERLGVEFVHYMEDLPKFWEAAEAGPVRVMAKSEVGAAGIPEALAGQFPVNTEDLVYELSELRLIKQSHEIVAMLATCDLERRAVIDAMSNVRHCETEKELAGIIAKHAAAFGDGLTSFPTIAACGIRASTLHSAPTETKLEDGKTIVLDSGLLFDTYCSDCTRTFPVRGRYNKIQRDAYELVLRMNEECISMVRPGVRWEDVHAHSLRVLCEGLRAYGLINAEAGTIEEQLELDVPNLFMPHGLGHLLGLTTHDCGGYPRGVERIDRLSFRSLRLRRDLQPGMIVTVEPGMYFVSVILEKAFADPRIAPHLNRAKIEEWAPVVGGIRIEDDVLVTRTGSFVFPAAPKDVASIEALVNE